MGFCIRNPKEEILKTILGVIIMRTKFIENAFDELLKCQYERISETNLKVTLPVQPLFINSVGIVHGGIICSLADIAMGNTFEIDESNRQTVVTVDLKTTFIK